MKLRWGLLLIFLLLIPLASAEDYIIINSENWQDVYVGIIYSVINDIPVSFITDYDQGIGLLDIIDEKSTDIFLIESVDPIIENYKFNLESKGFVVDTLKGDTEYINNHLLKKSGANKILILDDSYGHNAIAVGGYAAHKGYMPVFIDKKKINYYDSMIEWDDYDEILVYGEIDREVKDAFSNYITEHINEGDKFSNNFVILKRHLEESNRGQIILTNGEFIEYEILSGSDPVVLVGKTNVPDDVIQAINDAGVTIGIAIGTEIIDNAVTIKNEAGLQIFVKFAQGWDEIQYPLDTFPLPSYDFLLEITKAEYNLATNNLEVTYNNPGKNYLVFKSNHEFLVNGENVAQVSDEEGVFISEEEELTLSYEVDLTEYYENNVVMNSNVLMGEETKALEYLLKKSTTVEFMDYTDESEIKIKKMIFNSYTQRFQVTVINSGDKDVYVDVRLEDVIIDSEKETLSSEKVLIPANSKKKISIKALLEPIDYDDNDNIKVKIFYGERENALINVLEDNLPLKIRNMNQILIVIIIILLLLIVALTIFYLIKKKG